MLRELHTQDISDVTDIYNHYIENTTHTFAEQKVTPDYLLQQIEASRQKNLPWLVCENAGQIIGYAYAGPWKPRSAYRHTVESSIYLSPEHQGHGVGSELYSELIQRLREQTDSHLILAGITLPNEASVRLHQRLGFEKTAHFKEIGYKFGQWLDVGYWTLTLPRPV
ncbi:MAG: N-acetyltransferase [Gammaproteobacteria bacterium]|nr:GNAT family N-acetyltransferase [Gammaproteobacteria bacterium]NNC97771.1 N-acetyltransferase [Gammaproteobacteria bacterium]NNM14298.1 N-acetyltransferase [Gammaproteobacteria bacterium]